MVEFLPSNTTERAPDFLKLVYFVLTTLRPECNFLQLAYNSCNVRGQLSGLDPICRNRQIVTEVIQDHGNCFALRSTYPSISKLPVNATFVEPTTAI
jgi:hypothetical protein